ncbi:MAG: hypothetical protein SGJ21_12330 [Alphaproteobacteria bacterium]|nr:hypothetical protein [Alphaproteobacteria bacterium]
MTPSIFKTAGLALAATLAAACAGTPDPSPAEMASAPAPAAPAAPQAPAAPTAPAPPAPAAPKPAMPPEYVTIKMEIDVAASATDAWSKIGAYCDLGNWIAPGRKVPCEVTKGDGAIGSVRSIANGAVIEVLTAKTDLAYGYTQPAKPGQFYDLYHGFLEARPVTAKTSKLLYTLMYDVSDKADQAAKDADVTRRRTQFEGALKNMKALAEAK